MSSISGILFKDECCWLNMRYRDHREIQMSSAARKVEGTAQICLERFHSAMICILSNMFITAHRLSKRGEVRLHNML